MLTDIKQNDCKFKYLRIYVPSNVQICYSYILSREQSKPFESNDSSVYTKMNSQATFYKLIFYKI